MMKQEADSIRVSEEEILAGHFLSTRERALVQSDPVVVLHDTTEFIFKREDIDSVGRLNKGAAGKNHLGRINYYTSCGILMHSSQKVFGLVDGGLKRDRGGVFLFEETAPIRFIRGSTEVDALRSSVQVPLKFGLSS